MIKNFLLVIVSLVASTIMFYAIKKILLEGIRDDLAYPLVNCDTSMFDEIKPQKETV